MKKQIIILLVVFAGIITIFGSIVLLHISNNANNNENMIVGISEISIKNNIEEDLSYEVYFHLYDWPDELKEKVEKEKEAYSMVSIVYVVRNFSENTAMNDIRFYPQVSERIKDMIAAYNSGDDTYLITAHPNLRTGMTQHILIKTDGKTNDEILEMLNEEVVDMTYDTAYSFNKKKYRFKIGDALTTYMDNPQLFD